MAMRWRRNARRPKAPTEPGPRKGRILTMVVVLGLGIVAILGRAFYLQVTRHDDFMKRSEGQHRTQLKLTANRGDILDRNGQLVRSFSSMVSPSDRRFISEIERALAAPRS